MTNNGYLKKFEEEYAKLNSEQRQAVDTIEGPVMVIAGAGTGKTQTIAVRIAKILLDTQVNPSNILCLTFTDNAAINMRSRLLSIIGSTAYSVRICTFHAFCNSIIKNYPEYFISSVKESIPLDDVSQLKIIQKLVDQLPATSPLKNINSPYFFQKDIIRALETLKKENISVDHFTDLIAEAKTFVDQSLPQLQSLQSIRATAKSAADILNIANQLANNSSISVTYQARVKLFIDLFTQADQKPTELKSNIKSLIEKTQNNLAKQTDLLQIYRSYQDELAKNGLYDYNDMILWVIKAFQNHSQLLSEYQETYQYILVDEFQDTNSSQYEIINLLTTSQDLPNIFVVGDDDQSIFRFQGASVENVFTFYQKYQSLVKVIILKNNYRSHRLILESSNNVISHNLNRITAYIKNIDKSLVSVKTFDPDPINLFVANSPVEENYFISQKIKSLVDSKVACGQIAVLFRNNADIDDLLPYLNYLNLSYTIGNGVNIFNTIEIKQLITLFKFINNPDDSVSLAKVLSFNFMGINSFNLYRLFQYCHVHHHDLAQFIISPSLKSADLGLSSQTIIKLNNFVKRLASVQKMQENYPLDKLFNEIIRKFKFLKYILKHQRLDLLKQLNTLYSQVKSQLLEENLTLPEFVNRLSLLADNNINLLSPPLLSDENKCIQLMTVHKAKGLEFEHVFLIKVVSGKWDSGFTRNNLKLPLGILKTDITALTTDADTEEDRRLFYVALTRAKNQIYLSYSRFNNQAKEQLPSLFINEIDPKLIEINKSTPEIEKNSLLANFSTTDTKLRSPDLKAYLQHYFATSYRFNITHLNSYLHCPLCFFFKTILHLPAAKNRSLSFGTSVHGALSYLFQVYKKDNRLIDLDQFLAIFEKNLGREHLLSQDFSDLTTQGRQILTDYYLYYQSTFSPNCLTEHDFKFYGTHLGDIPITGKIDKIEFIDNQKVNVVDFKTGKPDSKYKELSPDGDYFRQLVFYKILSENSSGFHYQIVKGTIDFVQKNSYGQFKRSSFDITPVDVANLTAQIKDIYQKITSLQFSPKDDCPDADNLHYLFDRYFVK